MVNVVHTDKKDKQKAVVIALGPVPRRVMHTVHGQQRLKSVKTPLVLTHYPVKSGNVAVLNQ
jgi:hypothetical protein